MFSLVSGLWAWWRQKREVKILILGLDNAGKSTLFEQLRRALAPRASGPALDRLAPTVGLNVLRCSVGWRLSAVFWDLGGQLLLRSIWEKHYAECDGLVFVVDTTDAARFPEARATLAAVLSHPALIRERSAPVPFALLLNKADAAPTAPEAALPAAAATAPAAAARDEAERVERLCEALVPGLLTSLRAEPAECRPKILHYPLPPPAAGPPPAEPLLAGLLPPRKAASRGSEAWLVAVAHCSALHNVNIKPAVDHLMHAARGEIDKKAVAACRHKTYGQPLENAGIIYIVMAFASGIHFSQYRLGLSASSARFALIYKDILPHGERSSPKSRLARMAQKRAIKDERVAMQRKLGILLEGRSQLRFALMQNRGIGFKRSLAIMKHLEVHEHAPVPPITPEFKDRVMHAWRLTRRERFAEPSRELPPAS